MEHGALTARWHHLSNKWPASVIYSWGRVFPHPWMHYVLDTEMELILMVSADSG